MPGVPLVGTGLKLPSVPPVTSMSLATKLVAASDRVKVSVSLLVRVPLLVRVNTMVGGVVSPPLLP